jgi:hypothetical protein
MYELDLVSSNTVQVQPKEYFFINVIIKMVDLTTAPNEITPTAEPRNIYDLRKRTNINYQRGASIRSTVNPRKKAK